MVREFYALNDRSVRQFQQLLNNGKVVNEKPKESPQTRMHFVKLTENASAASANEMTKSVAQLYEWNENEDPCTFAIGDLAEIEVWNPHDVEIPSGTLCIIGKFPNGWVIITPVNWCPPA